MTTIDKPTALRILKLLSALEAVGTIRPSPATPDYLLEEIAALVHELSTAILEPAQ